MKQTKKAWHIPELDISITSFFYFNVRFDIVNPSH